MVAFVIGNGISRNDIDLNMLKGTTYGCNALYRDFTPDVLVALDNSISRKIEKTGYALKNKFYTRRPTPDSGALSVGSDMKKSSGGTALHLATISGKHDIIYLLGFDFGSADGESNNCYAGTQNYLGLHNKPKHASEILIYIKHNKDSVKYIRVVNKYSTIVNNIKNITVKEFLNGSICNR
jgi:hypothetical protein